MCDYAIVYVSTAQQIEDAARHSQEEQGVVVGGEEREEETLRSRGETS